MMEIKAPDVKMEEIRREKVDKEMMMVGLVGDCCCLRCSRMSWKTRENKERGRRKMRDKVM